MVRVWVFVIALLGALGFAAWCSDFVTMQGERTVYTVECRGGTWTGDSCGGHLVASARYRFRALKAHSEVMFWVAGGTEPSGKFEGCEIQDGRNWRCKPNADVARSITLEMTEGLPVAGPLTRTFRAVPKWRWLLLERGLWQHGNALPVLASAPAI